jgi:hypothetical protein
VISYLLYAPATGAIAVVGTCATELLALQAYGDLVALAITRAQSEAIRANRAAWHVVAGVLTPA